MIASKSRRRGALLAGLLAASLTPAIAGGDAASAAGETSRFTSITPTRVIDSRTDLNMADRLVPDEHRNIQLAGLGGVPANATGVVATFTVTGARGGGWMQVYPQGQRPPVDTSVLNTDGSGDVATTIFVPLNSGGITVRSTFDTELLIDVSGYFTAASSSQAGRYVAVSPTRLYDSRSGTLAPDSGGGGATAPTGGGKVIFVGDSITRGSDASENFANSPTGAITDNTFRRYLWQSLSPKCSSLDFVGGSGPIFDFPETPYDGDHLGSNGIRTVSVADDGQVPFFAGSGAADVVVIELGANDAQFGNPTTSSAPATDLSQTPAQIATKTIDAYQKIVIDTRVQRPNAKFVFVAPYDIDVARTDASFGQSPRSDTNTTIAAIRAGMNTFVSSITTAQSPVVWVNAGSVLTTGELVDGIHPSQAASSKLANLIQPQLISLLGCNPGGTGGGSGTSGEKKQLRIDVAGRAGVPATGASAVVIGLTATGAQANGWLQVGPAPLSVGASSNINLLAGQTRANLAVVPLDSSGGIEVYTDMTTDYLVDVMGYFTDSSASNGSTGLFIPTVPPVRHLDSRSTSVGNAATITLPSDASGKSAVILNLTSTANRANTWLQVAPTPINVGSHSNVNVPGNGVDVAVGAITPIGSGNRIDVYVGDGSSAFILDIMGYFS